MSTVRLYGTAATPSCNEHRDLYQTLGVEPSATTKEIKAAYYQLSKIYHPDRHDGEEQKHLAAEKFLQVRVVLHKYNCFWILRRLLVLFSAILSKVYVNFVTLLVFVNQSSLL